MTEFTTPIARVQNVEPHPDEDLKHLSVVTVLDKKCICGNLEDGSPRYKVGDLVLFCPVNSVIPVEYLKYQGFYWDAEKDRGLLKGNKRNRVGPVTRGSVTSEGLLFPTTWAGWTCSRYKDEETGEVKYSTMHWFMPVEAINIPQKGVPLGIKDGDDLKDVIGITEFKG